MSLEDDIRANIERVASNAQRFESKQGKLPAPQGERSAEFITIPNVNAQGEVIGEQVVEKHSGFHYSEESQRLLGKHKSPPKLTPGVIYGKDGEPTGLNGRSSDGSRMVSS
jgi:hypothetical protein